MPDPLFRDGVIVIDKPAGPTSHDVVAVMRRTLLRASRSGGQALLRTPGSGRHGGKPKVGHTGTLDPLASGVLPLVIGKATRLAQFLSSAEKEYEAEIELGVSTTTHDRSGRIVAREPARTVSALTTSLIEDTIAGFRGTYLQQPPAYSAKKIDGDRAYDLARRSAPVPLQPVTVTAAALDVLEWRGPLLRLRLVCSAGYYVRSLADAIGARLGTGAHLAALVRTRSGEFSMAQAVGLDVLDRRPGEAAAAVIPLEQLLPSFPALTLTEEGASLAARGGFISRAHVAGAASLNSLPTGARVRLLHPDGRLVAVAEPRAPGNSPGTPQHLLHPSVVLE
jgi:tRNA pseudouridine55 synthase